MDNWCHQFNKHKNLRSCGSFISNLFLSSISRFCNAFYLQFVLAAVFKGKSGIFKMIFHCIAEKLILNNDSIAFANKKIIFTEVEKQKISFENRILFISVGKWVHWNTSIRISPLKFEFFSVHFPIPHSFEFNWILRYFWKFMNSK